MVGLRTVGVAAASGVACIIGSALIRNAGCDRCEVAEGGSPRDVEAREGVAVVPGVEAAAEVAAGERWARRMAGRQQGAGTGRGG